MSRRKQGINKIRHYIWQNPALNAISTVSHGLHELPSVDCDNPPFSSSPSDDTQSTNDMTTENEEIVRKRMRATIAARRYRENRKRKQEEAEQELAELQRRNLRLKEKLKLMQEMTAKLWARAESLGKKRETSKEEG